MRATEAIRRLALAALLVLVPPAFAAEVGRVNAVDHETRTLVIDGQTYRLAETTVPRYSIDTDRLASLRGLKPGTPVEYETRTTSGGDKQISRLLILSD